MGSVSGRLQAPDEPLAQWRRVLVVGTIGCAVLLVGLLFVALYLVFPEMVHTGDAQLQVWLGPTGAQAGYLALGIVLGAAYGGAALRGTGERQHVAAWLPGIVAGSLAGAVTSLLYVGAGVFAATPAGLEVPIMAVLVFNLVGAAFVGVAAGRATRTSAAGAIAGFWLGAALALLSGIGLEARDLALSGHLVHTAWVGDHFQDVLCNGVHGAQLIGCEVGDDLGWLATSLLVLPIVGLVVGSVGGAAGRLSRGKARVRPMRWGVTISTPLVVSGFLLVLMIVESLTNIW